MEFNAYGHKNIRAEHKNTVEITKDRELSRKGDCIIGVNADFKPGEIRGILSYDYAKLILEHGGKSIETRGIINKDFNDEREIVARRSDFASERTLLTRIDNACIDIPREFVDMLKDGEAKIRVKLIPLSSSPWEHN